MVGGLVGLLILIVVVGFVLYIASLILAAIPMPEPFGRVAWLLLLLVGVLIIVAKALPMIGVSV